MIIGYARVSNVDKQDAAAQIAALRAAKAGKIYEEIAPSGRWKLNTMERIDAAGAGLRSLTEAIDTTTAAGCMLIQMVGSFAEFERVMIRKRTRAGFEAARRRGRIAGRRPKPTLEQRDELVATVESGRKSPAEATRLFAVHPLTVSRRLAKCRQRLT